MSKLHRDNAGYVGCSYEDTQDPYYSYNKLSLSLAESDKTVIREEQTVVVTQANGKFVIDGVSQAPLSLVEGNVYTFDLSDSSVASHPFRIKKNPTITANTLDNGLPSGYSAITSSQYSGTVSNIETDDTNELYAVNDHIDFDLGSVKVIHNFIAKFRSNADDSYSADYRIELHSGTAFDATTLLAFSPTLVSENTSDIQTIDHDFGGVSARYVRWKYTGGSRSSYLRYFYPYIDTSNESLITSGTQGQSGATAKYVVPFGAGPLAYYCASHSGMGADIATTANARMFDGALPILKTSDAFGQTVSSGYNGDSHAANLYLALPLKDNANDVSASINPNSNTKAASVSSVSSSNSKSKFYGSSHQWNANTDGITYAQQGSELVFGTGDYTIECWFYNDNSHNGGGSGRCYLFDTRLGGSQTGDPPQVIANLDGDTTLNFQNLSATITTLNKWVHFAGVRKSGTIYLFVDGRLKAQGTETTNHTTNGIAIGRATDGGYGWAGYIQDFRVYKSAKYTADFVLPDQLDTIDRSGNSNNGNNTNVTWQTSVKKFYDGAAYFNGLAVLDVEASSEYAFGSEDFSIEFWVKTGNKLNDGTYRRMFVLDGPTGDTGTNFSINIDANGGHVIAWGGNAGPGNIVSQGVDITDDQWHHIAVVRQATTVTTFVDGSPQGSGTDNRALFTGATPAPRLGGFAWSSGRLQGYMQDVRIYKGIAKYTSSFSPPERSVQGTARRYPSGVYVVS